LLYSFFCIPGIPEISSFNAICLTTGTRRYKPQRFARHTQLSCGVQPQSLTHVTVTTKPETCATTRPQDYQLLNAAKIAENAAKMQKLADILYFGEFLARLRWTVTNALPRADES
jgi:hypothetical protein